MKVDIHFVERVDLIQPIRIEVREDDGEVNLWWKTALLYGSGKSHRLAYEMLCREIRSFAADLRADPGIDCKRSRGFLRHVRVTRRRGA